MYIMHYVCSFSVRFVLLNRAQKVLECKILWNAQSFNSTC